MASPAARSPTPVARFVLCSNVFTTKDALETSRLARLEDLRASLGAAQKVRADLEAAKVAELERFPKVLETCTTAAAAGDKALASLRELGVSGLLLRDMQMVKTNAQSASLKVVVRHKGIMDDLAARAVEAAKLELELQWALKPQPVVPPFLVDGFVHCLVCQELVVGALPCPSSTGLAPHGFCFNCVPRVLEDARRKSFQAGPAVRCLGPSCGAAPPFAPSLLAFAIGATTTASEAACAAARNDLSYLEVLPSVQVQRARNAAHADAVLASLAQACVAGKCTGCGVPVTSTNGIDCSVGLCPAPCSMHFCTCCYGFGVRGATDHRTVNLHIELCPVNLWMGGIMSPDKAEQLKVSRSLLAALAVRSDRTLRQALGSEPALEAALEAASDNDVEMLNALGLRLCGPGEPLMPRVGKAQPRIRAVLQAAMNGEPALTFCLRNAADNVPALTVHYADLDAANMLAELTSADQGKYEELCSHFRRLAAYCYRVRGALSNTLEGKFVLNLAAVQLAAVRALKASPLRKSLLDIHFPPLPAVESAETARRVPVWGPWEARVARLAGHV
jgi:hypothetical protein